MGSFRVGQKVVCVKPNRLLKKGEIYTVENNQLCSCGNKTITLSGFKVNKTLLHGICPCGASFYDGRHSEYRFRPLIDESFGERICAEITEKVKQENFELA